MQFEILDNRQGEWESDNIKECKYFVRCIDTGYLIGVSTKSFAKEMIRNWDKWDFGQYETEF